MNSNQDSKDILGVLNANTDDSLMESLKEEVKATNKFNLQLSKEQKQAREEGYLQSASGVIRSNDTPQSFRQLRRQAGTALSQSSEDNPYDYSQDSGITPDIETEYTNDMNVKSLYQETLGNSAYKELKHKLGLSDTDSFTDYYNRTGYIPAGFEMEARLALAEEKRMKLYVKYQVGELSETDFLYQAYGKDLLKEAGHDLDSSLYWYNKYKQGDFTSPLDSDTFLADLIANANDLWQSETWYQNKNTKTLASSLAGVVTGTQLSNDKVYELFKEQFDVLDEFFDNDINKIIAYYQAGSIGMDTFNPFLDTDGDGKYDYYYHIDGKMYAVKGSSGVGKSQCEIEYTQDAAGNTIVHSVDVTDGPDWLEGVGTGLRNFVMGFVDIGYLVGNAVGSIFGPNGYGDNFVNNMQDYEAWKARNYLGGQTEIILDGSSQWTAYNVSAAVGEIAGTIVLTIATWGAGGAATAAKTAGTTAVKASVSSIDDIVRLGLSSIDDLARAGLNTVDDLARIGLNSVDDLAKAGIKVAANSMDDVGKELAKGASKYAKTLAKAAVTDSIDDFAGKTGKEVVKMLQRQGVDQATINQFLKSGLLKSADGTMYKLTGSGVKYVLGQATGKVLDISKGIFGTLSRAKTGQGFGTTMWMQALSSSSILAVQDFASTYTNLSAANKSLEYLASLEGSNVIALTEAEIFKRAGTVAATDLLISTMFRLSGSDGLTTKVKSLADAGKAATGSANKLATFFKALNTPAQASVNNLSKHLVSFTIIDNVADAIENVITSAVSIAANNAYGDFNFGSVMKGAGSFLTSPSGALMTAYITGKNFISAPKSWGRTGDFLWGQSTLDQRKEAILNSYGIAASRMDSYMTRLAAEAKTELQLGNTARAEQLESIVNHYYDFVNDPKNPKVANIINFIQEFDKFVSTQDSDTDTILSMLGLQDDIDAKTKQVIKSSKEKAKEIKDILVEFGKDNPEMGVFAAYVLHDAKAKNVADTFKAYEDTLNSVIHLAKGKKDSFTQILKGKVNLEDYFNEGSWQYKHVKKFIDSVNEMSKRVGVQTLMTMSDIQEMFVENRVLKLQNEIKDFDETFDTTFNVDVFSSDTVLQEAKFTYDATTGKVTLDTSKGTDIQERLSKHENPLIQLFAFPEENAEAIKTLIDMGVFRIENGRIIINTAADVPIIGALTLKPNAMNEAKDLDTAKGKLYAIYKAIADLGQAVDSQGNPVADWETPLLTEIEVKNPLKSNGSGNDTTYKVFLIGNKLDANLYKFFNKPQMLNVMVKSLYTLNTASDINTIKTATLNFILAMSDIDETNLNKMTDAERNEFWEQHKLPLASAILAMSNASSTKTHENSLFSRSRLLYLYTLGLISDESLNDITTSKVTVGVSAKAKEEAEFLQNYIKTHNQVANLKNMFIKIAQVVKENAEVKLNTKDFDRLKKFLIEIKKPENKLILEALKEDKIIDENLNSLIEQAGVRFPFLEGLEDLGQLLVDLQSAGTSSIANKEVALKNFLLKFLNKSTVESFRQSYNSVYEGMRGSLIDVINTRLSEIKDTDSIKETLYNDIQSFKQDIIKLKNSKLSKQEKLNALFKIVDQWFDYTYSKEEWSNLDKTTKEKAKAFHGEHGGAERKVETVLKQIEEIRKDINDFKEDISGFKDKQNFIADCIQGIKDSNPDMPIEKRVLKTLKTLLFLSSNTEIKHFFKDPESYLEVLRQNLIMNDISKEAEINKVIAELNNNLNPKDIMTLQLNSLNSAVRENTIRTYLTIALGESKVLDGDIHQDDNGDWKYSDGTTELDVVNILLNSNIQTADILQVYDMESKANEVKDIILNYNTYIHEGTVTKAAPNIIEINILDLVPKEFTKLLTVYRNSIDAMNKHNQILEAELKRELSGILDGASYNYQTKEYIKLLRTAIASNNFILTIPLPNSTSDFDTLNAFNEWKGVFKRLGYENDFVKLTLGEAVNIPGVFYKDGTVSALETGLSFDVFKKIFQKGMSEIKINSSQGQVPVDYKTKLVNMFNSITYVTGDTELSFTDNQIFYGVPKTGDIEVDIIGSTLLDRFVKAGLSGGEFAKVFNIMNRAMYQPNIANPKAENSFKALQLYHKLTSYSKGEFVNVVHEIPMNAAEATKCYEFYKQNPDSLFIPVGYKTNGVMVFKINPNFDFDNNKLLDTYTDSFNIRTLLPVWGMWTEKSGHSDYQTAFSIAMSLGFTREDIQAMADTPLSILNISTKARDESISNKYTQKRTFSEYSKLIPEDSDNYYLVTKKAYVDAALTYSAKFEATLEEDDRMKSILKFANRKSLVVLGNLLNNPEFKNISVDDEEDLNRLLTRYNQDIVKDLEFQSNKVDSINYYNPDITSADVTRLTAGTSQEVTLEDIKALVSLATSSSQFLFDDSVANGLPEHNSAWAIMSCIDVDNGEAYISMEYYEALSLADRKVFMDTLIEVREAEGNTPVGKALSKLITTLEEKNTRLTTHEVNTNLYTNMKYDTALVANAPSVIIDKTMFAELPQSHIDHIVSLVANRKNAKTLPSKFISSSSMDANSTYNPLVSAYMELINQTLYRTVDKQGHTMVFNLNSKEAIQEFFGSIYGFKGLLQTSDMFKDIDDDILYELAMKANLYSTGTTIDAEYSGALILEVRDDGTYKISPVEVSSGDPTKGIYSHLLFNKDTGLYSSPVKKKLMITLNKNTFVRTPGGMSADVRAYDLNNEETRTSLLQHAYYKALEEAKLRRTYPENISDEELILDFYLPKTLTTQERYSNMIDTLVAQGVDSSVAEQILPSIQKLNVANETSLGEEQFNNLIAQYVSTIDVPNEEMQVLKDVLLHKITKESLPQEAMIELHNFVYNLEDNLPAEHRETILRSVDLLLDYHLEDKTNVYNTISTLPLEAQQAVYKLLILNRESGKDLNFLMNKANLFDYSKTLREKVGNTKDPNLDFYKNKVVTYDSEWTTQGKGVKEDFSKQGLYQIGFTVTEPIDDYTNFDSSKSTQYTILILDSLLDGRVRGTLDSSNTLPNVKDDDLFYTEDAESFKQKIKNALEIGVGNNRNNVYIVKTKDDAITKFEELTQGVKHFAGYNNKAEGSDNKWFGDFFERDGRQVLDVRTDVNHKVLSRETEGKAGDSLDFYGEQGIISRRTAHDANSDVLDTIDLFLKISNSTIDVADVYDELGRDALDFCAKAGIQDTEAFLKGIKFQDIFTKSRTKNAELFDSVDITNKNYVVGNKALKEITEEYNSMLSTRYRRVRKKELKTQLESYIYDGSESRKIFISSVKDPLQRTKIKQVIQSLLEAKFDLNDRAKAVSNYTNESHDGVLELLEASIRLYKKETYKDSDTVSNGVATEEFLSLDLVTMRDYITRANEYYDPKTKTKKTFINKDTLDMSLNIDNIQKRDTTKIQSLWESDLYQAHQRELPNTTASMHALHYFLEPVQSLLGFSGKEFDASNVLGLDADTANLLLNNLVHIYGTTEENFERLTSGDLSKRSNKIDMFSKVDKKLYDEAVNRIFGDEFYSTTALYFMAHEEREGRTIPLGKELGGAKAENGVVYISEKLLRKAYPDLNYKIGDEFFTQVWRQPGQHKTVMHVMKVKVVRDGSLSMTRTTAKTYFNGDFDGDFYYFATPKPEYQEFGKDINKYLTAHMSLLNNLFNDIKLNDIDIEETCNLIEKATHALLSTNQQDLLDLINNPSHSKLALIKEIFINSLDQSLKAKAEDIWEDFGFKIVNFSEVSNENKNILITNNPYLKTSKGTQIDKETYHKLLMNSDNYLHANQYADYFDSQSVGDIAKKLRGTTTTGDASKVLYTSRISLTEDVSLRIESALETNGEQVYTNLVSSIDNLVSNGMLQQNVADDIKLQLGSKEDYINKTNISTLRKNILVAITLTQDLIADSPNYNDAVHKFLQSNVKVTKDDIDSLRLLVDSANTFLTNKITLTDEDLSSHPMMLKKASEVINAMTTNKERLYNRWLAASHSNSNTLFRDAVLKGNVDIDATDRLEVISNRDKVFLDKDTNSIGTKVIKVAVAEDNIGSDTMLVTANNEDRVETFFDIKDITKLTSKQKEGLFKLYKEGATISGHDLNTFLNSNQFRDTETYTFRGAKTTSGEDAEYFEDIDQVLVSSSVSVKDSSHYFKVGLTTGKAVKTTLGVSDVKFEDKTIGYILPKNMLINPDTGAFQKLGANSEVNPQYTVVEGSDGLKYRVYEISDAAIIDTSADKNLSVSSRNMDVISILQGSQGLEASVSFGKWFLTISDNDITYDPEGFRMLRDAIESQNKPLAEETNGMAELNFLKIASLFKSLDDETFVKVCAELKLSSHSRQEALFTLYKASDLGGSYGEDIIDKLQLIIQRTPSAMAKFKEVRDSSPILQRVWGTELNSKLQSSWRQTSQDFLTEDGKPIESYRSKNQIPKTNARYSPFKNDMNIKERMIAYDGSAIDYNTNYIGKFDLLNTLMPEGHLSKKQLDTLYEAGIIDYVKGRRGNLYNNFKFIQEGQGRELDYHDYDELLPDKKVGVTAVEGKLKNQSQGTVTGLVSNSKGTRNHSINDTLLSKVKEYKESTLTPALHTRLGMMFSDGTDESIYNSLYPQEVTVGYSSSRPYLGVQDGNLSLKTASNSNPDQPLFGEKGIAQQIIDDTKSPIGAIELDVIRKDKESILQHSKAALDFIASQFTEESFTNEIKTIVKLYEDSSDPIKLEASETFWKNLHDYLQETEEADTTKLIKLYSNSNDIELVNSVLRSWGFKAKGHKDISLGSVTISLDRNANNYKGQLLSRDYDTIVTVLKTNPNSNYAFNYYMEFSRRLDMYKELINEQSKWIKKLGTKRYNAYIKEAESQLLEDFSSIQEVETKLNSMLSKSPVLKTLVNAAHRIEKRIQESAREINPYTILGYSIPMYKKESKKKTDRWFGTTVVANKRMYNNQEYSLLSGRQGLSNGAIQTPVHLYDADCDGWVAMIQRISTDLSADLAMSHLKNTLVTEGWMRNADITLAATKYFEDNLVTLTNYLKERSKLRDIDIETYNILRNLFNDAGVITPNIKTPDDFLTMYTISKEAITKMFSEVKNKYGVDTLQGLYELQDANRDNPNFLDIKENIKLANAHQQLLATLCSMFSETSNTKDFFIDMYNKCQPAEGYVLVDDRGSKLTNNFAIYKDVDLDGYARSLKYGNSLSEEDRKIAIAKMMLCGEVYQMKSSVADQLEAKVFTKRIPNKIQKLLRKASQLTTSLIMSTPLQLIDRILNYTIYDVGVIASTNASALQYLHTSIATIRKYMNSIDSIDEYSLRNDTNLQYLIRYITASGQNPLEANVFKGEQIDPSNIPVIKSYLKKVNEAFNQQNLVARFAYYLDLVHSAEKNGGNILSTKAGVAYHMMNEISKMKGDYKAVDTLDDTSKHFADIDVQAAQIIAENLGAIGNNPYGATTLGRMGFVFTTFPLIGARWASNRLQSLAYAFTHLDDGSSIRYLGRNLGSTLLTTTLLLALEILLSEDSQEYLFGNKDEMSEEELQNAENIIFRGGCVKLFDSILKGEESTTAAHNRGTEYALYDSFLKELLEKEEDETFLDGIKDTFKTQIWSHMPTLPKDIIESIPGNTLFQSTTWATPSDNFFDNYVRKISGYLMGSAQATAFMNSLDATEYEEDMTTWDRIGLGLQKAYTENNSNIKEYKSEYKNYKKAFNIIYDYSSIISSEEWKYYDPPVKEEFFADFKSELNNALKNKTSSAAIYNLIATYKAKGMSLSGMLSALKSSSLKSKLTNMENLDAFMASLSDSEKAIIKSALIYEDYNYPYLEDVIETLTKEYSDYKDKSYSYKPSISQLLYYYSQNTPKSYDYGNSNYYKYNNFSNYYNQLQNLNYSRNTYNNQSYNSPTDVFTNMMNTWKYGKATDLYGNNYSGYTNIKGETWKWDGDK